ncbi:hypothetical protein HDA32_002930 [Spinactinospora alkalitolerans]|uniref:Uncharacterized protein n=1 Tax=Spinactinospora alkalitolerans TaxID=687207 RepID=A0A852U1E2_9ACTN|nr:hypothetical protein [Spinactinospora alkalitolerans]
MIRAVWNDTVPTEAEYSAVVGETTAFRRLTPWSGTFA